MLPFAVPALPACTLLAVLFAVWPLWTAAFAAGAAPATDLSVHVDVIDSFGSPVSARVHVRDALGRNWPPGPDSDLLSHDAFGHMGGYFYTTGAFDMTVPPGLTRIAAGCGFEWRPALLTIDIQRDTTLTITLSKPFDLRPRGWYSGDTHVHTRHEPLDYDVEPAEALLMSRAEDLSITWLLDQEYEFSGGPHTFSTAETILYYTTEYRNQTSGHVALLGLKILIGDWCCEPPEPVYPLLTSFHLAWHPDPGEAMVVAHPWNGGAFFGESGWPDFGLARELPVMAAFEQLEAVDVCSYSNAANVSVTEWYDYLDCGLRIPPSAGTDAVTNAYIVRPPGGYRVYACQGAGAPHTAAGWVDALRAGRVFVTNYPLLPEFTVDGAEAGAIIDRSGPSTSVIVSFRVECALPLTRAVILRNRVPAATIDLPSGPEGTVYEAAIPIGVAESSWIALRVEGATSHPHAASAQLFAHTGPVYVHLDGAPVRKTAAAAEMLDRIDLLETLTDLRGNWPNPFVEQLVSLHFEAARDRYRALFIVPPAPFGPVNPPDGHGLPQGEPWTFEWTQAADPEPGDLVSYVLAIASDSLFTNAYMTPPTHGLGAEVDGSLFAEGRYWWKVIATDRGEHVAPYGPVWTFTATDPAVLGAGAPAPAAVLRLTISPQPARSDVRLAVSPASDCAVAIYDLRGRRVAGAAEMRAAGPGAWIWNGRLAGGAEAPSGIYWAVAAHGASERATARILLVR